jgi:hypothetical protein
MGSAFGNRRRPGVRQHGSRYQVKLDNVYHGSYDTKAKANAVARRHRLASHGQYTYEVSRGLLNETAPGS